MPRLLLIDDDPDLVMIIKTHLKKKGYNVEAFTKWDDANKVIRIFDPELILLDVFLEGQDGLQICNYLKASPFTRHIPILILSGYPRLAETAIFEFGADEFLSKPFEVRDLVSKINVILSKRNNVSA